MQALLKRDIAFLQIRRIELVPGRKTEAPEMIRLAGRLQGAADMAEQSNATDRSMTGPARANRSIGGWAFRRRVVHALIHDRGYVGACALRRGRIRRSRSGPSRLD